MGGVCGWQRWAFADRSCSIIPRLTGKDRAIMLTPWRSRHCVQLCAGICIVAILVTSAATAQTAPKTATPPKTATATKTPAAPSTTPADKPPLKQEELDQL